MFFIYIIQYAVLVAIGIVLIHYYQSYSKYTIATRIFNITEYTLLAVFFSLNIRNNFYSKFLKFSILPFIIFCIADFYNANEASIAFFPLVIECIIFLGTIVFLFFEMIQDEEVLIPLYGKMLFWIASAFILYFAGNFLLFMYAKNSVNDKSFQFNYIIIYASVTILKNILLCIGVTIKEKKIVTDEETEEDEDFSDDIPLSKKNLDFLDFDNDSR